MWQHEDQLMPLRRILFLNQLRKTLDCLPLTQVLRHILVYPQMLQILVKLLVCADQPVIFVAQTNTLQVVHQLQKSLSV